MTHPLNLLRSALFAALLVGGHADATEFRYAGTLSEAGAPANGRYDLELRFAASETGATIGAPLTLHAVEVRDGRFEVGFEGPQDGQALWLEVAVRKSGEAGFSALPGRDKALAATLIGSCWSSTGDPGTNPATHFLGTTDAQPLVLRTRNVQSLRLEPSNTLFGGAPITTNTIAGSSANAVAAGVRGATIGGGGTPAGDSDPNFSGEAPNRVTDSYGVVGGGYANRAGAAAGPGSDSALATVSGGAGNSASAHASTVAGGSSNSAAGAFSAVGGGNGNLAGGLYSTVVGGVDNCAGGVGSLAAGVSAKVRPGNQAGASTCAPNSGDAEGDEGSFVWSDGSLAEFVSTGPHQFLVHAQGGLAINTNTPTPGAALTVNGSQSFGSQTRQMLNLWGPAQFGIGVQADTQYYRSNANFAWFQGGSHAETALSAGSGGNVLMTLTPPGGASVPVTGTARAQTFTSVSDRAVKTAFEAIDPAAVLESVVQMPITTWAYRNAPGLRHMGPVAQDFRAAFGLGEDDTSISTVDADGVALAAIQGLNRKLEAQNRQLQTQNQVLRARLDAIEARLGRD